MKQLTAILVFMAVTLPSLGQERDTVETVIADSTAIVVGDSTALSLNKIYTDEYLDTVQLKKKLIINDYSMIGVQYGVSLSQMMFNPTKRQTMLYNPVNFGIFYTKYGKLFSYLPYFGFQTGVFFGKEGYKFKKDKKTGEYTESVDGATQATYSYIEVPLLAHLHVDVWKLKLIVNGGLFGGYRLDVEREGDNVPETYKTSFYDYDRRFEYGCKVGGGIGLMLDPVEFHIQATYRISLGSLYKPDYSSEYYYRFAYPSDIVISAGVHIQLTKRSGKTRAELRREAKDLIYGKETDNEASADR